MRQAGQMSKSEALRFVVETLAQRDGTLIGAARELDRAWAKGGDILKSLITRLGAQIQDAIQALPMDRCDLLTMAEVTALLGTSERNAERHIRAYLQPPRQVGQGPGEGDYHVRNKHDRQYWRWFYHLQPLEAFGEEQEEKIHTARRNAALKQRNTPEGLDRRRQKIEADMRELGLVRAVLKSDRLDLVQTTLAAHPEAQGALADFEALKRKLQGMGLRLEDLMGLQTFVQAQVTLLTTSVMVRQPWLVDAQGRLTDHAWWPIDHDAQAIQASLLAGGTVVHGTLVEVLAQEWAEGDAYLTWSTIADLAAQRSINERRRHLAHRRERTAMNRGRDLPPKNTPPT